MDKNQILALYEIYVQTITANEARRHQLSSVYVTLIAAGASLMGVKAVEPIYIIAPVLVICLIWLQTVRYFRALAKAKFSVIGKMEDQFDLKPFALEWEETQKSRRVELTRLEMIVPSLIAVLSAVYICAKFVLPLFGWRL